MNKFQEIFNPTPEQRKKQIDKLNELIQNNLERCGKDCSNCKHSVYVQESPYYDYLTCEYDKSIELSGGLDMRHCCDKYEFSGFIK